MEEVKGYHESESFEDFEKAVKDEIGKNQRYTHRNPVTGEMWDEKKGRWVSVKD